MKNDVEPNFLNQLDTVFAQLNPQAVEEFYAAYRQWDLLQRIAELRHRILWQHDSGHGGIDRGHLHQE